MPMRLMILYPVFVLLLLLLFSVMYNQIEDSRNNNSIRRKKGRKKKLWRTSCLHGITKNVAKTQCSYRISHFRSVRFHTPFSSTFCCFLFHFALFCWFFFLSFLHQMLYCVSEMSFQSSADFSLEDGYQCLFLVKKMWPLKILFTCTEQMTGFCFLWTLFLSVVEDGRCWILSI